MKHSVESLLSIVDEHAMYCCTDGYATDSKSSEVLRAALTEALAAQQAVPALDESEVEDLARSAFESAMSFGIDFNSYERLAKHIWKKMLPAAPKGVV